MLNGLWAFMMLIGLVWAAFHGNLAAGNGRRGSVGRGGGYAVPVHAGNHVFLDGDSGSRPAGGPDGTALPRAAPASYFFISQDSGGTPGAAVHFREYDCQYAGAWLGGHAGRTQSHAGAGGAGGGAAGGPGRRPVPGRPGRRAVPGRSGGAGRQKSFFRESVRFRGGAQAMRCVPFWSSIFLPCS